MLCTDIVSTKHGSSTVMGYNSRTVYDLNQVVFVYTIVILLLCPDKIRTIISHLLTVLLRGATTGVMTSIS